jgi:hypothetical protein
MTAQPPEGERPTRSWADAALIVFGGGAVAIVVELALRRAIGAAWADRVALAVFVFIAIAYRPRWRGSRSPSA